MEEKKYHSSLFCRFLKKYLGEELQRTLHLRQPPCLSVFRRAW